MLSKIFTDSVPERVGAARAAVQGTEQVAGAIIASTLTTICVFLPMVFTTGTVRELMMPISLTIIFTLGASLFIAMTVVPAAGSTLLKKSGEKKHPWFDKVQEILWKNAGILPEGKGSASCYCHWTSGIQYLGGYADGYCHDSGYDI